MIKRDAPNRYLHNWKKTITFAVDIKKKKNRRMNHEQYAQLLVEHDIKPTANRIVIARALALADRPMSISELEENILTIDKSNIFRALTLFKEHHLVHTIEDGSDGARFELCRSHSPGEDEDVHVHFYCERCHRTFCMENTPIPTIKLPEGYRMTTINYIVKGLCPECNK